MKKIKIKINYKINKTLNNLNLKKVFLIIKL